MRRVLVLLCRHLILAPDTKLEASQTATTMIFTRSAGLEQPGQTKAFMPLATLFRSKCLRLASSSTTVQRCVMFPPPAVVWEDFTRLLTPNFVFFRRLQTLPPSAPPSVPNFLPTSPSSAPRVKLQTRSTPRTLRLPGVTSTFSRRTCSPARQFPLSRAPPISSLTKPRFPRPRFWTMTTTWEVPPLPLTCRWPVVMLPSGEDDCGEDVAPRVGQKRKVEAGWNDVTLEQRKISMQATPPPFEYRWDDVTKAEVNAALAVYNGSHMSVFLF